MNTQIIFTAGLAATFFVPLQAQDTQETSPNLLLIVSDDHGTDDAGCYGNTLIHTPNLDYLASEGILFTNAFCTSASCSASRSVILTGLYNHANGQYGHQHSYHHFRTFDFVRSLPVLLSEAGYRTARVGKYHVGPERVYLFDEVFNASSRDPVAMSQACEPFIAEYSAKPFFLYFCTSDPHRGGGKATELDHRPDRFGNKPRGEEGSGEQVFDPDEVMVPYYLPDIPETRAELAQYYQSVSRVDHGLGVLFELLKENGKWDNTVIIYISDNGIAFPGAKTNLYEPGMNLPCIVRDPAIQKKGQVNEVLVNWADITPTLLDYAGALPDDNTIPGFDKAAFPESWVQWSNRFHGRSFKNILDEEDPEGRDVTYASHTFHEITMYYPMRVVRGRDYKLIWNIAHGLPYPHASDLFESATWQGVLERDLKYYAGRTVVAYTHRPEFELYDLKEDPGETVNLAGDPDYSRVLETMKQKLRTFQERTSDPWIIKWEHE